MKHDPTWSEKVRQALAEAGLTQRRYSEMSGIPIRTIEDWCRGISSPQKFFQTQVLENIKSTKQLKQKDP